MLYRTLLAARTRTRSLADFNFYLLLFHPLVVVHRY